MLMCCGGFGGGCFLQFFFVVNSFKSMCATNMYFLLIRSESKGPQTLVRLAQICNEIARTQNERAQIPSFDWAQFLRWQHQDLRVVDQYRIDSTSSNCQTTMSNGFRVLDGRDRLILCFGGQTTALLPLQGPRNSFWERDTHATMDGLSARRCQLE